MQVHPNFVNRFEGVTFPVKVKYCGECGLPIEYCSYFPDYEKCKIWLEKNLPSDFEKLLDVSGGAEGGDGDETGEGGKKSGRQKRGGKGIVKTKKKAEVDRHIGLWRANRGKKKYVTIVSGLTTFEIDLKEASKFFAGKFACGSSVTGNEVVIQGDVKDDLFDIITEKWPEVDEDSIEDMGEKKI
ncbi:density-regulated protein homolog [Tetranychus urticae]|uniref:Density-regulated protein n=1 Tax=Tetranychus urticae TaxID=32264 RepID=T1KMH4_TETUR|nr:density-regulated protein homolog [Tetranychus urticae]